LSRSTMPAVPSCGATLPLSSLRPLLHRRRLRLPPVCSQDRQRSAPTEGNLSAGRPARNKPIEPPTKLARGNNGSGGASSGSRLPPHVSHSKKNKTRPEEAEQAAALASSAASTDLQFLTALVRELEAGAARRADEVAAAAEGDFETAFYRRKMALLDAENDNGHGSSHARHDPKHLRKTLNDAAELRRGQLRALRHAVRDDVQALVREGKASRDEAARADVAVEGAFRRAGAALEEAAAAALERAAKLAG
jgi:hypothetical protein